MVDDKSQTTDPLDELVAQAQELDMGYGPRGDVPFRSRAFDWAHAAVRREQAPLREMLKTWRRPVQKGISNV